MGRTRRAVASDDGESGPTWPPAVIVWHWDALDRTPSAPMGRVPFWTSGGSPDDFTPRGERGALRRPTMAVRL